MTYRLGIDLGGTKLLACLVDDEGTVLHRTQWPTGRDLGPTAAVDMIARAADTTQSHVGDVVGIGVGFPGLVDPARGIARSSVILDGWHEVPLADQLSARLDLPVFLDNDVANAARAELSLRRDCTDMLFVAVGTGIGGALILGGKLWHGVSGLAGEIGHVSIARNGPRCGCGRNGCVGMIASGAAIERQLGTPSGSLAQRLADADSVAGVLARATDALGAAIANALHLLNLPLVVVGGGVAQHGEKFIGDLVQAVRRETFQEVASCCRIEPARAGYDASALGAAILARESHRRAPASTSGKIHPRSSASSRLARR